MSETKYTIKPFPRIRHATIDLLDASSRKHMIHGLVEVDISRARARLQAIKETTGESISFTGYIIYCCAQVVDRNKHMHAYRDLRGRLILFNEVDVSTTVEREVEGSKQVVPTIIRAANRKSVRQISQDIRRAQAEEAQEAGVYRTMRLYLAIPAFIRRLFFRFLDRAPHRMKENAGTIMVTSIGMFAEGGGWGIPIASHTLNITIGGIAPRPFEVDGRIEIREHLCLTVSFDHDIVDGAPAARFTQRFKKMLESAHGLVEEA